MPSCSHQPLSLGDKQMDSGNFMRNLLSVMPYWQYDILRPFAAYNKKVSGFMRLDTYYLLQVIRWFGGLTMSEIADHLCTTRQQATLKVDKLYKQGYIKRSHDPKDRRIIRIEVTPKAIEELETYYANTQGFMQLLREKLSEDELQTFNNAMESLLSVFPKLESTPPPAEARALPAGNAAPPTEKAAGGAASPAPQP